jgi:hypothetical protein
MVWTSCAATTCSFISSIWVVIRIETEEVVVWCSFKIARTTAIIRVVLAPVAVVMFVLMVLMVTMSVCTICFSLAFILTERLTVTYTSGITAAEVRHVEVSTRTSVCIANLSK